MTVILENPQWEESNDCDSGKSPMRNSLTAPLFGAVAAHAPTLPVGEKGQRGSRLKATPSRCVRRSPCQAPIDLTGQLLRFVGVVDVVIDRVGI
jgi:hypothetical protein